MRFRSILTVLFAVLLPLGKCAAQSVSGMTRGTCVTALANTREVQKELKLRPDQVKKIQEKQKDLANVGKSNDPNAMTNAMAINSSMDSAEKWMSDVFEPDQAKRFHELLLQYQGTFAFVEPSVEKDLELTSDQKTKVSDTLDKCDADVQALYMDIAKHPFSAGSIQKKVGDRKKAARAALADVLTPAQSTKWDAMGGQKFKFPKSLQSAM